MEPDRTAMEVQRRKLDLQTTSGGDKAERFYREAFLVWREQWNSTPGLPKLTNK